MREKDGGGGGEGGGEGELRERSREIKWISLVEAEERRIRDVVDRVFRARGAVATQKEKKKKCFAVVRRLFTLG